MAVTDESLQEKRERLEKLHDQAATSAFDRKAQEEQVAREIVDKQLDAEIAMAEAKLAREKRIANRKAVRAAAGNVIAAAKEDEQEAKEFAKADAKANKEGK